MLSHAINALAKYNSLIMRMCDDVNTIEITKCNHEYLCDGKIAMALVASCHSRTNV